MAILCVYLPSYSTTVLGEAKDRLAYMAHLVWKAFLAICYPTAIFFLSSAINISLKTVLRALLGKRYLFLYLQFFHFPEGVIPPPGMLIVYYLLLLLKVLIGVSYQASTSQS